MSNISHILSTNRQHLQQPHPCQVTPGAVIAGCWLGRYNTISVCSPISLCVQIVHFPVIHIDFPPSASWSRNSHRRRCSFCPPTPQRFSRRHLHHGYRCGRYRGQRLIIDVHRKAQEGLKTRGNRNHQSRLDLLEYLLLLLHRHQLGFCRCHLRFLYRS